MLGRSSGMCSDKSPFLLGRRIEPLEFSSRERRGEARVGGALHGSHRGVRAPGGCGKGGGSRGIMVLVFPGETVYRKAVRKARRSRTSLEIKFPRYMAQCAFRYLWRNF